MAKLNLALERTVRAVDTLSRILDENYSVIVRDAAIQRFEYSSEALWKLLQVYLADREGLSCGSPKSCFRSALKVGLLTDEETERALLMVDDRNLTSHTYIEAVAESIFSRLPGYHGLMKAVVAKVRSSLGV